MHLNASTCITAHTVPLTGSVGQKIDMFKLGSWQVCKISLNTKNSKHLQLFNLP